MPALVWDFDGVMVDSITQRAILAHLTYEAYKQGRRDIGEITPEDINPENQNVKKTVELLKKKRPYLVPDEGGSRNYIEQLILLRDYNLDFDTTEEFLRLKKEHNNLEGISEQYSGLFFSLEEHLSERFGDKWIGLARFYEGVKDEFVRMRDSFDYYICSCSEGGRILNILRYNGIDFDQEHLFSIDFDGDKEIPHRKRTSKAEKIRKIMEHSKSNEKEVHYIDDEVSQALIMNSEFPNMHVYLATWGYVPNGWKALIENTVIVPVSLDDFSYHIQNTTKNS